MRWKWMKIWNLSRIVCVLLCVFFVAESALVSYAAEITAQSTSSDDSLKVTPIMNIPSIGYEGHEIVISDASLYKEGLENKGLEGVYNDGQVWMELLVYDSKNEEYVDIGSGDKKYEKKVVFRKDGNYGIEMLLHLEDDRELTVKKRINIEKTPCTEGVQAGAKKQERLQRIEFKTAQNPEYPLVSVNLDIKTTDEKECASVRFMSNGKVVKNGRSAADIILRSPECAFTEDKYFFSGNVEFMTLFDEDIEMSYEINAEDVRGNTYKYDENFTVLADRAPVAEIDISDTYTREEGCNYAVVTVEDISETDGDELEREWFVRYQGESEYRNILQETGYTDLSGGGASRISFYKNGVGEFFVKLKVRDVWSEGTMEEFTQHSARLEDETECRSEVANIAPRVSAGTHSLKKADMIVIADSGSQNDDASIRENISQKFLSKGAEVHISTEYIDAERADEQDQGLKKTFIHEADFGYHGQDTSFENELYTVDELNFYSIDATWSDPDKGYPEEPYTIIAENAEDGSEIWSFQFDSKIFDLNYKSAYMYQDDSGKYLYITSNGKTLVFSKRTGRPIATIDMEFGEYNFVNEDVIYTYKNDGIYRVLLSDGSISKVWSGKLSGCVRRIHGYAVTYSRNSQGTVIRISLNTADGSVEEKSVGRFSSDLFAESGKRFDSGKTVNVVGIDVNGRAVLEINMPIYNDSVRSSLSHYKCIIQVYDSDGALLKQFERKDSSYSMKTFAVTDKSGAYNYIGISHDGRHKVTEEVMGLENDYAADVTISDSDGDPAIFDEIISALEMNGNVYVTVGGMCAWIYNQTWANGPTHGYPARCKCFSFDLSTGSAVKTSLPEGCIGFSEYSKCSNMYMAVRSAQNSQYAGYASIYNNIVKRSQNIYDMLSRVLQKDMKYDSSTDHKVIYIEDAVLCQSLSQSEAEKLGDIVKKAGYSIYIKTDGTSQGIAAIKGAQMVESAEDAVDEMMDGDEESYESNKKFTSVNTEQEGKGKVSRSFDLRSDKKYFYEYTLKSSSELVNSAQIEHSLLPVLNEDTYGESCWYVADTELEDFNDDDINEFFEYDEYSSSGGLYTDCYILRNGSSNIVVEKSSYVRFTIPEGKQAVLSFDYIIYDSGDSICVNGNYAEIDGQRWEETPGISGNGNYVHPYILEPGEHELKLYACEYGSKLITYTYIDDLKLSYISREKQDINLMEENISQKSENLYKVSGSFTTPGAATCFREMKDVFFVSGKPGDVEYTSVETEEDDEYMHIDLPEGVKALSSSVKLISYAPRRYSVKYTMSDFVSVTYYNAPKSESSKLYRIPEDWKYIMPTLSGSHDFHAAFDDYRRTQGQFSELEMYIAKDTNLLIENHKYIKSENDNGEKSLFLGEKMYGDKTVFSIITDSDTEAIYDFSIYTVENGRKIYIETNNFSDKESIEKWSTDNVSIKYGGSAASGDEDEVSVYAKGQFVNYNVTYWDYEDDPSKQSYWRYTHVAGKDGAFENAAVVLDEQGNIISENDIILNEPVNRFYKEGKYIVEHWQEDDTSRGAAASVGLNGEQSYDKESNHVLITFYIGSIADAPWIKYIKTAPRNVYEGDSFGLEVGVDDADKEDLTLNAQVYCGSELIAEKTISDIKSEGDIYAPVQFSGLIKNAECGSYKVVCAVSDSKGVSTESIKFNVTARGNIEGMVYHTEKWEENRRNTDRGADVFWPGERLMLKADVEGEPVKVTAWIEGEEDEVYDLQPKEGSESVYCGSIWKKDMMCRWGSEPVEKKVIFSAEYKNGDIKLSEYSIIFDNSKLYWNIYRKQGA